LPLLKSRGKGKKETMKTVAAFLLAVLGGNNSPSAEDIKKILASVICSLLFIFFFLA
jgi:hypothetical protein